jgi:uncharacterized membrane protein
MEEQKIVKKMSPRSKNYVLFVGIVFILFGIYDIVSIDITCATTINRLRFDMFNTVLIFLLGTYFINIGLKK